MKAYQLKITLQELETVWRRVVVPEGITFKALHDVIQYAMGWTDSHLYQFVIEEEKIKMVGSQVEMDEYVDCEQVRFTVRGRVEKSSWCYQLSSSQQIDEYLRAYKKLEYVYDMGDDWVHTIEFESIVDSYEHGYPICLEGSGDCPPEDSGGIGGYLGLLEILNNPDHLEFKEMETWLEEIGYEGAFDLEWINKCMATDLNFKKIGHRH